MSKPNSTLAIWNRMVGLPAGKWLFSKLVCQKAPYFASISPTFVEMRPGYVEVHIRNHRAVHNHIGTVHAIAMCNMAELAAGTMTEISIPASHRWIPKGMTVEYLKKAETDLRAIAELNPLPTFGAAAALHVPVKVIDNAGQIVFRAEISMWVSPKKASV